MKKRLFVIASVVALSVGVVAFSLSANHINNSIAAPSEECSFHHGYHYEAKAPDMNESGHKEFWACCVCGHQYLSQPNGEFITQDDQNMIGGLDENHIAYLPPVNNGGTEGEYWVTDPFDED